jgi:hypothetical protein
MRRQPVHITRREIPSRADIDCVVVFFRTTLSNTKKVPDLLAKLLALHGGVGG